jgi:hypothetical protein
MKALQSWIVALALLPAPVVAQTLDVVADKRALSLGTEYLWPADLDGNKDTREWVQYRLSWEGPLELRGVAFRAGALCVGQWFEPWAVVAAATLPGDLYQSGDVRLASDGRVKFVAQGHRGYYEVAIGYGCQ